MRYRVYRGDDRFEVPEADGFEFSDSRLTLTSDGFAVATFRSFEFLIAMEPKGLEVAKVWSTTRHIFTVPNTLWFVDEDQYLWIYGPDDVVNAVFAPGFWIAVIDERRNEANEHNEAKERNEETDVSS